MNWLTEHKIPLGDTMETFVNWLIDVASFFFDFISVTLETLIFSMVDGLEWMNPFAVVACVLALVWWLHRSLGIMIFVAAS
ncbi:MAG: choline ABC transporter permease subunit, partial [Marinomonas gallaica]